MPDLAPGTVLAGCRIEDVAGRGGMGVVYRATDLRLGREVAIKVIGNGRGNDREFQERFEREARMAARIDHPNVVPVYAAGEADGRSYLVMRHVDGTDLHRELAARGPLPPDRAVAVVAQIADALDAAHAAGLVHRDVKPANVLLCGERAYLTDFGLTRLVAGDTSVTETGRWMGTVDYASPEQLQGRRCDARSDVYALGCVLFAALTGGPPFPRGTIPATLLAHLHDPPPRVSGVTGIPPAFDRVLARALAKDPEARYPSTGDLARAALAAARGEHVTEEERSVARGPAAPAGGPVPPAEDPHDAPTMAEHRGRTTAHAAATVVDRPAPDAATRVEAAGDDEATRVEAPARDDAGAGDRRDRFGPRRGAHAPARHAGEGPGGTRPAAPVARGRRRRIPAATAVLAVAAVLAAALALRGGDPPQAGPVDGDEVRGVVDRFASAVGTEDAAALGRTLARTAARVTPGDRQDGRDAVAAEYRRQFAGNAIDGYELEDLEVEGGGVGRAVGAYRLLREGRPPITGRIVFDVVRERGRPRIALIAATPD